MSTELQTLRAIVVDDERLGREAMRSALREAGNIELIGECANGLDAIEKIRDLLPDVVFLDIRMPEVDGFGVIFGVGVDRMPPVVFVTAHDEFALKAFEVHAIDYLLKPYTKGRLAHAIERVRSLRERGDAGLASEHAALRSLMHTTVGADGTTDGSALSSQQGYATRLLVKRGDRIRFVDVDVVDYFEADGSYVHLHVGREKHTVRRTLKDVQSHLDPGRFVRIHRSTIVNLARIKEVQPWFNGDYVALLTTGEQLRVSRWYRDDLLRPQF